MQLTVRDAARLLDVPERSIYKWIDEGSIPFYLVNEQYRFNPTALLEWANSRKMRISGAFFGQPHRNGKSLPTLVEALGAGGIFHDIEGTDRNTALRSVVRAMPLPDEVDREFVLQVLMARETSGSTGIGGGIAIPHARSPMVLHVPHASMSLCFLRQPIDFAAIDRQPVHTIFSIISPTSRVHLHLLSRLAAALHDQEFLKLIAVRGSGEEILREVARVEATFASVASDEG